MLSVGATEFRHNQGKYLKELNKSDIGIELTKNDRVVAIILPPVQNKPEKKEGLDSIAGVWNKAFKNDMPKTKEEEKQIIKEYLTNKYESAT